MNSNHSTLRFRYEENKMECKHRKKQSHRKENTDCNVNNTRISDTHMHSTLLFKKLSIFKNIDPTNGFQPPIHQVNANIYINDFFPRIFNNKIIYLIKVFVTISLTTRNKLLALILKTNNLIKINLVTTRLEQAAA